LSLLRLRPYLSARLLAVFLLSASLYAGVPPTFVSALPSELVLIEGSKVYAVRAADPDSNDVSVSAVSSHPGLRARISTVNRFAQIHIIDSTGSSLGSIIVELFETRGGDAAARFIALATTGFDAQGEVDPGADPFFTDVPIHRIVDLTGAGGLIIQTGDKQNGNGTGGSPLGDFDDQFDIQEGLNFSEKGVLAMANSGANTNDSQFFITDGATTHLDGKHMIFGQVISGQSVIAALVALAGDTSHVPRIASVDILDSAKGGALTIEYAAGFQGKADVTVTLEDEEGNRTSETIAVLRPVQPLGSAAASTPWSVTVHHDLLYIADGNSGLRIVDVSDPTTPTPLSIYADGFDARHVVVVDYDTPARTVAFVAARLSGTLVLDVTDPDNVTELNRIPVASYVPAPNPCDQQSYTPSPSAYHVLVSSSKQIFISEGDNGLRILDGTNPVSIGDVTGNLTVNLAAGCGGITSRFVASVLRDSIVYSSDRNFGLFTIDVSDASNPTLIANTNLSGPWGLALGKDDRLYVAEASSSDGGMSAFSLTAPTSPSVLGRLSLSEFPWQLAVDNTLAITASGGAYGGFSSGGFSFIQISESSMTTIFKLTATYALKPTIGDDRAYLPTLADGVRIFDIQSLTGPEIAMAYDNTYLHSSIDLGAVGEGSGFVNKVFTVYNDGLEPLVLGGLTLPAGFSIVVAPPATIDARSSATFTIGVESASLGPHSGPLQLVSNDRDEPLFTLSLSVEVVGTASIQGLVWEDTDWGMSRNGAEPGIPGVRVYVDLNGSGEFDTGEPSALSSGEAGSYTIQAVPSGTYAIRQEVPVGWAQTLPTTTHSQTLTAGQEVTGIDFGNRSRLGSIAGLLWNDQNANGIFAAENEAGIASVTITLYLDDGDETFEPGEDGLHTSTSTDNDGRYVFTDLPPGTYWIQVDESSAPLVGRIRATRPNPLLQTVDWDQSILFANFNYFTPPTLSISNIAAAEGNTKTPGTAIFPVTLSFALGAPVTVHYTTVAGSALPHTDFAPSSATLTIAAGETVAAILVPLVGDEIAELAETFSVTLSNPLRAALAQTTAEASISDADLPIITVVAADAEAAEGVIESGEFRFSLLGETDEVVSVNVGFSGAADNTDDVFYTSGQDGTPHGTIDTLEFAAGQTVWSLFVAGRDDDDVEGSEELKLQISPGPGYVVGVPSSAVVILDDDDATDLTLELKPVPERTYTAGEAIDLEIRVINSGDKDIAGPRTFGQTIGLSSDLVWGNDDDIILTPFPDSLSIAGLPAAGAVDLAVAAWIPPEATGGTYYVAVYADSGTTVDETNEDNNVAWSASDAVTVIESAGGFRYSLNLVGTAATELRFGMLAGGSSGNTVAQDIEASGSTAANGQAYFVSDGNNLNQDMRGLATTDDWFLTVVAGDENVTFSWDTGSLPTDRGMLLNEVTDADALLADTTIYFSASDSLTINAGNTKNFRITVLELAETHLELNVGWHLLAFPFAPLQADSKRLFEDTAQGRAWAWTNTDGTGHYVPIQTAAPLQGVWLFLRAPIDRVVHGTPAFSSQVHLSAGWNLTGTRAQISAARVSGDVGSIWSWTGNRFQVPKLLAPGKGYWFHAEADTDVELGD